MDPVATLQKLRELAAEAIAGDAGNDTLSTAAALAETFQALDDWMRGQRRGYSPWDVERDAADRAGMPQGTVPHPPRWPGYIDDPTYAREYDRRRAEAADHD
jgi:hypothetical protein